MHKSVSLNELQIVVNRFDSSANVGNLVFDGFEYSEKMDYYKVCMYDVVRAKRYLVAFERGKFVAVIDK